MRIAMIGTGYVGLVSGVCFSEFGFDVTCVDTDPEKIARLNDGIVPIFEPGLEDMLARNTARLTFTTDLEAALSNADAIFIAVGTPSRRGDGEADLTFVEAAARQVAQAMRPGTLVVVKSTVVVGTTRRIRQIIADEVPGKDFSIASNPEFLREGSAIEDFMRPDRVVVGVDDERGERIMRQLYRPLNLRETPIVVTSLENAEITKYAANAFLAMKVTFINEIADLCEKAGGDVQDIAKAIGIDNRIGSKFLHPGPGYGGSCFPKDTRAMAATAARFGAPIRLVETTIRVNDERIQKLAEKVADECNGNLSGKTIAVLGIAFKPNTDDIREAASMTLIPALQEAGANIRAHDPEAMTAAKGILENVAWCDDAYEACSGADIVVVLTEWNEYRGLDLARIVKAMRGRTMIDFRNVFRLSEMQTHPLRYVSVGRPAVDGTA
jgi:UDPglucose 6-dehydrogenase